MVDMPPSIIHTELQLAEHCIHSKAGEVPVRRTLGGLSTISQILGP